MKEVELTYKEKKDRRRGLLISIGVHVLLLALAMVLNFGYDKEDIEIQGILINVGYVDAGASNAVARENKKEANSKKASSDLSEFRKKEEIKEAKLEEEALESKIAQEKAETLRKTKQEEERKKAEERKSQEEKEAEKAQRKAEEEAKRKEEFENSKKQFGDLFGKGLGTNDNPNNQGDPKGKPNQKALEGVTTGMGQVGGGLSSRGVLSVPEIREDSQKTGTVVIKVCVDIKGNVIKNEYTQLGSTTTDSYLIKISKEAAGKYKFTQGEIDRQCGIITFKYSVK